MKNNNLEALQLARRVVRILDIKARAGCYRKPEWDGMKNGNGTEIGKDIEALIRKAKRIITNNNKQNGKSNESKNSNKGTKKA